ncbi:hypothetical protein L9F63_025305, partial [Diploptera punctata]
MKNKIIKMIGFYAKGFAMILAAQKDATTGSGNALDAAARSGPYFDKVASKNVTALLGKTAYLNCRVKNLGNKTQ